MEKLFLDLHEDVSKNKIKEYRAQGKPDCLIVQKDNNYFNNYVVENRTSFLRFFVEGAMHYYKTGSIPIPASLNAQQLVQSLDKEQVVQEYALEHLRFSTGEKTSLKAIRKHFRNTTKIESITLKDRDFDTSLRNATLNLGPKWVEQVQYYNMWTEDGKGMGYLNVAFSHLMVGIAKYTKPVLPALKKLKKINKIDVVRNYSLQHLEVSEGAKTRLCDIREHFKLTNKHAENRLNDKIFSALLLEVVKKILDGVTRSNIKNSAWTVKTNPGCI